MAKRKGFVMNKKSSGRRSRRSHSPAFKAKVALAALSEDKTAIVAIGQIRTCLPAGLWRS
jgi:hypothetical protein